jgi:hypothetical protein
MRTSVGFEVTGVGKIDPDAAGTLHLASDRAAGRLDLTRGDAVRLKRLQPETTEIQVGAALCGTMDTALELLAELCALWLQHRSNSKFSNVSGVFATATAAMRVIALGRATLRGYRVVLRISPLNTQPTPQVP